MSVFISQIALMSWQRKDMKNISLKNIKAFYLFIQKENEKEETEEKEEKENGVRVTICF